MRDLVRDDAGDALARADRRRGRIDQQQPLAERDRADVFHRAGGEVEYADDVELAERIFDAEVVVVELQLLRRRFEREARELALVRRRADADGHASDAPSRQAKSPTSSATRYDDIRGARERQRVGRAVGRPYRS